MKDHWGHRVSLNALTINQAAIEACTHGRKDDVRADEIVTTLLMAAINMTINSDERGPLDREHAREIVVGIVDAIFDNSDFMTTQGTEQ